MAKRNIFFSLFFCATILAFPIEIFGFADRDFYILTNIKMIFFIAIIIWMCRASGVGVSFFKFYKYRFDKRILPAVLLLLVYLGIQLPGRNYSFDAEPSVILLLFSAGILGAFAEELVFRLFIPTQLFRLGQSQRKMVLISAIMFSIIHTMNIFKMNYDVFSILNQLVFAFFTGIVLASLFLITRSILFVWTFHFLVNLPGIMTRLAPNSKDFGKEATHTFADDLVSTAIFLLLMSPLFFVSLYYLRKIGKNDRVNGEDGGVNNFLFNT